ncbi:MAG: glycoside hydrolase family 31 protein [Ginsengibacter sp.]
MKYFLLICLFFLNTAPCGFAQPVNSSITLPLLENEQWWGGAVQYGDQMPFNKASSFSFNLYGDVSNNQSAPLLISNKGRWIWCDAPFLFSFEQDTLHVTTTSMDKIQSGTAGNNLQSVYQYVSKQFFPSSGRWPDSLLVTSPQYNLWIELQYNPNQKDVLNYADKVLQNGWPAGVLMIDDNWSNYYGELDFDKAKFPDAKDAITRLHQEGFKVMLWICPFITPDSKEFRELLSKKYLLLDNENDESKKWEDATKPLLIRWWNGYSACLDLTNPGAKQWLKDKLQFLQNEYGVDGFKLDAGDPYFYNNKNLLSYKKISPNDQCTEWAKVGLEFPLNEYRAMWKMGGEPLVERLADKNHTWEDLQTLVPNTIAQQLLGHTFTCPDMIGGGNFTSFLPGSTIDQKLIVRSAQVHALMPMMQFSVAPWRVLDPEHLQAVNDAVKIRQQYMAYIMSVMRRSARTGEPALRPLAYNYPGKGYEMIKDQFMMGDEMLVAPVVTEKDERDVVLPSGDWAYQNKKWSGDKTYHINVSLNEVPVFMKTSKSGKK